MIFDINFIGDQKFLRLIIKYLIFVFICGWLEKQGNTSLRAIFLNGKKAQLNNLCIDYDHIGFEYIAIDFWLLHR